jgi:hypothetical protein
MLLPAVCLGGMIILKQWWKDWLLSDFGCSADSFQVSLCPLFLNDCPIFLEKNDINRKEKLFLRKQYLF